MNMKYGYFNDQEKAYIITNPKTPVKWINYIGTLSFGGFLDQTGGSLICKGDPAMNRIVKYIPQLPPSSFNGETGYIRYREEDEYQLFSPYFTPVLKPYQSYQCKVGMGYNIYQSKVDDIHVLIKVFVPLNDHRVIRDITITNMKEHSVEIDFIPVVEYTHFEALKQFNNADWVPQTMISNKIDIKKGLTVLTQCAFMRKDSDINFFTSNHQIHSFETSKKSFLGDNGYGTFKDPVALKGKELSNTLVKRGDNIHALMHHIGDLKPGESKRIITQLGQTNQIEKEVEQIAYFYDENHVDQAFHELKVYWDDMLSKCTVNTPNKEMNSMLNIFNPRQCNTTLNWSRYLSLYQLGLGARGIGFRDSSQDIMGALGHSPEEAKLLLIKLISMQKMNGSAMHQFNPKTMIGNEGDSREYEDRYHFYGDDHLWMILAVTSYLKETGDLAFLEQIIPFYDKDKNDNHIAEAKVYNHLEKALFFTERNLGKNNLPLLGFADWNDTVNLPKGAESIFNANLYGFALKEMIELATFLNKKEHVFRYQLNYQKMKDTVNKVAWDGDWYIRYFDHLQKPYGSHKNIHGKIYTNAQSWSVISGFASKDKAEKALSSVRKYLNTSKGIKLSYPGYNGYDEEKGGITTYPPGAKENGGIFLHANPWVMIAETMLGNGDHAFEYYNQINPAVKNDCIEEFECEPYVYPQNILGNEHKQFGLARNSWLSGTASWTYQAGVKYILGVRPTFQGLLIDPCIPKAWEKFSVKKLFRNAMYDITVHNPNHKEKGVSRVMIDGVKQKSNNIPVFGDGKVHIIDITM
jgi:cellobiose phosphorylase